MASDNQAIDEGLHSRQLAVYGHEAMKKLSAQRVLISGLNGLGAEVAKNVILANVKGVTLHDTVATTSFDLASHFYLNKDDIGTNRASACSSRLQELNTTVDVSVETGELTPELIAQHQTVVLLDTFTPERGLHEEKLIELNELCRSQSPPIAFITSDVLGVFGRCFCDFGDRFIVADVDGEQPHTAIIASISKDKNDKDEERLVVQCVDEERIEFCDGDHIQFAEVEGMEGLCGTGPLAVTVLSPYSFSVPCPASLTGDYQRGGIVTQVKMPKEMKFRTFADCLNDPPVFLESDFSKFGRSATLHVAFRALHAYRQANASLPASGDEENAKALVSLAKHINTTAIKESQRVGEEEMNSDKTSELISALARTCRGVINPMCALFGGVVGQEVVKAASGKFHPLEQFLYIDMVEALPSPLPTAEDCAPTGSRYDSNVAVFGSALQQAVQDQKYFLVGAGALGCEFMKNFAMLGLACGGKGKVVVTDDDTIERSNLSRQFLFRNWHVGEGKAKCAAEAVRQMNNDFNIVPMEDRVSPSTENVFDDEFWLGLDGVCNALDNVKARLYVDSRCVFFKKPLLESGTLGTKCNTQVVVPQLTENYGATTDPPEKQAPDCTLHNFPHTINHCLSWGRSEFIGNFETSPAEVNAFLKAGTVDQYIKNLEGAGSVPQDIVEKLRGVNNVLMEEPQSFEECIGWARRVFEDYFSNRVRQLIHMFPKDAKTNSGLPFWSPPKRFPQALVFDAKDKEHMQFIMSAANLRAKVFGVERPKGKERDVEYISGVLKDAMVPEFVPKSIKIETDPNAQSRGGVAMDEGQVDSELKDLKDSLAKFDTSSGRSLSPEEFEKDDDTNFHMDFISATGNLRGRCYEITEIDKFRAKLVAGRIIPAIATTTAMATGFVCMELLKVIQKKKLEDYRDTFSNLALPLFTMSEPMPPKKVTTRTEKRIPDPINHPEYEEEEEIIAYPEGHTVWDKLEIRDAGKLTLQQLADKFQEEHKITIYSFVVHSTDGTGKIVFNNLLPGTKSNLPLSLTEIISKFGKTDPSSLSYYCPVIVFENESGDTVETPEVVLWF